jgi:hypothetical protein
VNRKFFKWKKQFEEDCGEPMFERFMLRAEMRENDLDRHLNHRQRLPLSALCVLIENQAAEFLIWLSRLDAASRERVFAKAAPELERLAELREQNYRTAQRMLREHRKNGHDHYAD